MVKVNSVEWFMGSTGGVNVRQRGLKAKNVRWASSGRGRDDKLPDYVKAQ